MRIVSLFLTRRNLETLLKKLDSPDSLRTLVKTDTKHPKYPILGADFVTVTAVENEDYYTDRAPGPMKEDFT